MVGTAPEPPSSLGRFVLLGIGFAAIGLLVYRRALDGAFVSDDVGYVSGNPWIQSIDGATLRAILDPFGPVAAHTVNYAPVHMLLHAAGWRLFGPDPTGHHVINVIAHAGASTLLAALFARAGLAFSLSAFAGAVFLLHPANVEAVAWIFQLKTVAAFALACGALLLEPRRPLLALLCFALALLTKIQAAFALPVAAAWAWLDQPQASDRAARGRRLSWLAAWALVLALVMVPESAAFERIGRLDGEAAPGLALRTAFTFALVGRYLSMAVAGFPLSAFHEPDPPAGWIDGWVLLGLLGSGALALRLLVALRRGSEESGFWVWAAAGFVPVSQVLPFLYPLADRYLYYILPGLLGGLLLALHVPLGRALAAPRGRLALGAAALLVLVACGWRSAERAGIWRSDTTLALDAARHYPSGLPALGLAARAAARRGDADGAVAALRAATARGFDRFMDLERDPVFDPVRGDPRFTALVAEVAGVWIARVEPRSEPTVPELLMLARAHRARGEWEAAEQRLEQALAAGGPGSQTARAELAGLRAARQRALGQRGESGSEEAREGSESATSP
jgi:hypothetical protein